MQILRLLLAGLALGALVGCGDQDEYKETKAPKAFAVNEPKPKQEPSLGEQAVFGEAGAPKDMSQALGAAPDIAGAGGTDSDYIQKCDVYWKFNYLKLILASGVTPPDFATQLKQIKRQAALTVYDVNKPIIQDIIRNIERGMEAGKTVDDFRNAGIEPSSISWGIGRTALEQRLRGDSPTATLSKAQAAVLDYEAKYHRSPDQVKREAYREASTKTDQLGHNLGLEGRKANSPPGAMTVNEGKP